MANQTGDAEKIPARSNGKHAGGRPRKYSDSWIVRRAQEYVGNYTEHGDTVPTIHGLSVALNVHNSTIYEWIKQGNKQLSNIVKGMRDIQASSLINNGLNGKYNSNITKLLLSTHGYTDSSTNTGTSVNITVNRDRVEVETQGQTIEVEE